MLFGELVSHLDTFFVDFSEGVVPPILEGIEFFPLDFDDFVEIFLVLLFEFLPFVLGDVGLEFLGLLPALFSLHIVFVVGVDLHIFECELELGFGFGELVFHFQ